jgi:malate dehydrogenase (oxaloacetate-decarboxylating)
MPDEAKRGGAAIVASGRTELQNPIHNILAFPGIIKGCMEAEAKKLNYEMLSAATFALAKMIAKPTSNKILPNAMDKQAVKKIAAAVKQAAILSKVARK